MSATTILMKGKYLGLTFEDVLLKDINYCAFVHQLKFVSKELQEFKDFLTLRFEEAKAKELKKKLEAVTKQHNNL